MEDVDERNGMNSRNQNEESKEERKQPKSVRRKGTQVKKMVEKEKRIKEFKSDGDPTKKQRRGRVK